MPLLCFIIEDEPIAVQILEDYIRQTPNLKTIKVLKKLDSFALSSIWKDKPDMIFLDLNTHGLNRDCINNLILSRGNTLVIFTTAYPKQYIQEILKIDLSRLGYLPKPASYDTFLKEVQRVMAY